MRLIDADTVVTVQTYDDMYEEWSMETLTVAEAMDKWSDEGCPPTVDAQPVRHGEWKLEAHKENANYRWNVTAECLECCDEKKEIWAGFFPNVPDWLARDVALQDASKVKLSNYCPNCGAKMDGKK